MKLEKNLLEWTVFGFSFLLVILVISYLTYNSVTHRTSSPNVSAHYEKDPSGNHPYRYKIIVTNSGGETAEEVNIEAAIMKGGESIEKAELQIAFSPKLSEREGWVNFSRNPEEGDSITVKALSYKKP